MATESTAAETTLGKIIAINRYPVKSMAGESLEACDIVSYGVRGDRYAAFYDESRTGWSRFVTARDIPRMLSYKAVFQAEHGSVQVTAEDGRIFGWDEALLEDVQRLTDKRKLSLSRLQESHPEEEGLLSVDAASILLVSDRSLKALESACSMDLDQRRFRGNFLIAVSEDAPEEEMWIGKRLRLGTAELQVDGFCDRCSMITYDPTHLERTPAVLKQVNEKFGLNFGVYASVVKQGRAAVGDKIFWT
ncbi:MOSC domain-containing protein [Paenibacillus sp. strain BS8-2]